MTRKASFGPHVSPRTRVLVLGSLPGEASLRQQRYYAHPSNRFWHLAGAVIGVDLPALGYEARLRALDDAGIGLWDTIASARREGSLDTALREIEARPLADFVAALPQLRAVAFNGAASASIGRRQLGEPDGLTLVDLPSSSAANAAMPLAEKQARWDILRKFLD
ncbi:DNA-deoxyinosine glycosylase [Novosphingobium sp. ZN18A2]|uniref:DNA-deoxyinosine glycosylase n=1 Tax=Novosphingobium sp. ZN18A2 TaxID=3079861 RepID=UPI0030CE9B7B